MQIRKWTIARFMESDNATNRYDYFVLAGTSLAWYLSEHPEHLRDLQLQACGDSD